MSIKYYLFPILLTHQIFLLRDTETPKDQLKFFTLSFKSKVKHSIPYHDLTPITRTTLEYLFIKNLLTHPRSEKITFKNYKVLLNTPPSSPSSNSLTSVSFTDEGVLSTVLTTGDNSQKVISILDTGSNAIVLPLPSFPATLSTFQPLKSPVNSIRLTTIKSFSCPSFIREDFICSKESYVGVGYNSILGREKISFSLNANSNNNSNYYSISYFLNTLYGSNPNVAITGIGFSASGLGKCSLFENDAETTNYEIKQENKQATVSQNNHRQVVNKQVMVGTFKTNVNMNEVRNNKSYVKLKLESIGNSLSGGSFNSIKIVRNGGRKMQRNEIKLGNSFSEFYEIGSFSGKERIIFDSGTNGLLLSGTQFMILAKSILELEDKSLEILANKEKMYFLCWRPENDYSFEIEFEEFIIKFPVDTISLLATKTGTNGKEGEMKHCSYINIIDQKNINVAGYPYWMLFDTVFSAKDMALYLKPGERCQNGCGIISK